MTRIRRALVIAAGDPGSSPELPAADLVIAADSGADVALAAGRRVDVVVGDMDSVSGQALDAARDGGARLVEHPTAKDLTDLELALEIAAAEATHIHVVMAAGGRLDHTIANLAVIASPRWASATIDATVDGHAVWVVRGEREIDMAVDETLSLIPMGGPATGVRTSGLRYGLDGETLGPLAGRGVSNSVVSTPVTVSVEGGVLLAIRPLEP